MKRFISFVQKEFYHILRDLPTAMVLLAMPIVQVILFGFAITMDVKEMPIAVLNPTDTQATRQLIERLDESPYLHLVATARSNDELEQLFKNGEINMAVVFCPRFEERLLHSGDASIGLLADASNPNEAMTITGYAQQMITGFLSETGRDPSLQQGGIDISVRMLYNPQMKSAYNFVPGVMGLILMLICAMMTAVSIVREKETGTMEILLVSPVKRTQVILAKMLPYFLLSLVNLTSILLLSVFVLDVPIVGSLWSLVALSLLFILVALALGLLISTVAQTQVVAIILSAMVLMLPTMLLSGMVFPIDNMPAPLRWLSTIMPARWYIDGVKKIMIEGLPALAVWRDFAVLATMAAVMITVSLRNFKERL
jgi:ABC-2 type transport system permease protein